MTRILWDEVGSRHFSVGVDRGVLYLQNGSGVPWNGLLAVDEAPSGADVLDGHYDGLKYFARHTPEAFEATIRAYTYPLEFEEFDGNGRYVTGQTRKSFDFSYRTMLGNDTDGVDYGYLIHLVYNAQVKPSPKKYTSITPNAEAIAFEWAITTTSIEIGDRQGSHIIIDTRVAYPWAIEALENILYGSSTTSSMLPSPELLMEIFEESAIFQVTDHGDGTWTADGPDDAIEIITPPWTERRRNLFPDPLARTTNSVVWGSTAGSPVTVTDPDGTTWARFTRAASANVRVADLKVGVDLLANTAYRFVFKLRSSTTRSVSLFARPSVTITGSQVVGPVVDLEAGVSKTVDIVLVTHTNTPTSTAGLTMTHNGTNVGETLDVTLVGIELATTAKEKVIHGDLVDRSFWERFSWTGVSNASPSVFEIQDSYFEITWPSAIYIDVDTYTISTL